MIQRILKQFSLIDVGGGFMTERMVNMYFCGKCDRFIFNDKKKCKCIVFDVTDEEGCSHRVSGVDEEEAALRYAQESNERHENYLLGDSIVIQVGEVKFRIDADASINYYAEKLERVDDE